MLTFIRYIEAYMFFFFAILDCVCYNEDFMKLRFYSIRFIIILAGLKKIARYNEDFVVRRLNKLRFHCNIQIWPDISDNLHYKPSLFFKGSVLINPSLILNIHKLLSLYCEMNPPQTLLSGNDLNCLLLNTGVITN